MGQNHPLLVDIGQGLSLMVGLPTIAYWKTSDRPRKPKRGTFGFNLDTSSLEYSDGSKWFAAPLTEA